MKAVRVDDGVGRIPHRELDRPREIKPCGSRISPDTKTGDLDGHDVGSTDELDRLTVHFHS